MSSSWLWQFALWYANCLGNYCANWRWRNQCLCHLLSTSNWLLHSYSLSIICSLCLLLLIRFLIEILISKIRFTIFLLTMIYFNISLNLMNTNGLIMRYDRQLRFYFMYMLFLLSSRLHKPFPTLRQLEWGQSKGELVDLKICNFQKSYWVNNLFREASSKIDHLPQRTSQWFQPILQLLTLWSLLYRLTNSRW